MLRWVPVSFLLAACAGSMTPAGRPDGGWHLKCGASLDRCTRQAEDLCKGRGYVVISGFSKRKLYGAELGMSQVEVREAELDVACADRRGELPTVTPAPPAERLIHPPSEAEPATPSPAAPATPASAVAPSAVAPSAVAPSAVAPISP